MAALSIVHALLRMMHYFTGLAGRTGWNVPPTARQDHLTPSLI